MFFQSRMYRSGSLGPCESGPFQSFSQPPGSLSASCWHCLNLGKSLETGNAALVVAFVGERIGLEGEICSHDHRVCEDGGGVGSDDVMFDCVVGGGTVLVMSFLSLCCG